MHILETQVSWHQESSRTLHEDVRPMFMLFSVTPFSDRGNFWRESWNFLDQSDKRLE